ncbi:MAG: hypothetical protein LC808_02235 [Actinobacteria bacterium]|nr:hypothetical protein [Actinomycetota bacterium]
MAELGQTTDPKQLVPGEPDAIDRNVIAIRGRGETMGRAGDGLKKIDTDAWIGEAGDAFRDKFSYEPVRWYNGSDSFEETAAALDRYTITLRWAQGQAAEAIRLWARGDAATQQAISAHNAAVDAAHRQNQANAAAGDPTVVQVAPFSDPGEADRQAARDTLARARQQATEAGDRASKSIRAAGDKAPEESLWDGLVGGVGDVLGFVGDVGVGLWDGVSGLGEFAWDISPHHLFTDPEAYGETLSTYAQGVQYAASNPVEFGKSLVSWDQWEKEPGRALGQSIFGVLPGIGALGKLAKLRNASKLAPDVKPSLRDYFTSGAKPKASDLQKYAEAQGWTKTQTPHGPPKYVDENGTARLTIKEGSPRTPGSERPHIEIRDENGQRTDPNGNPVSRKSPDNHTPIEWDF